MNDSIVANFGDYDATDVAMKRLSAGGFDMKSLSVVEKAYHTEEKVMGFYNVDDRIKV